MPCHNEAETVGLLLWKVRQVFTDFPREYQLLVGDDASTDQTAEVLTPYAKVLPLTVVRHRSRQGYARTLEELLRLATERSDRPKRDCAVVLHADFTHGPAALPDLVRRIDSGADLVVAQGTLTESGEPSRGYRWLRRWARLLVPRAARVPGVRDALSGCTAFRLVTLKNALRDWPDRLLRTEGWAANAELAAKAARHARRIDTVEVIERHDLRRRATRLRPWDEARAVWRQRALLRDLPPLPPRGRPEEATA
ncbi:MAG: glycosyltransferase family 2 protein [Gemmatimonadales bacterium]